LENVFISPTFPEEEDAFDPFGFAEPLEPLTPSIVAAFRAMSEVETVTPVLNLPSNMEVSQAIYHAKTRGSWSVGVVEESDRAFLAK
jgi:hypothetical protein